jgi:hypothetical protein
MLKAYNQTQAYFCQSISKSHLNVSGTGAAYFTGVPETHLNFLTIDQTPIDLDKDLTAGKTFFPPLISLLSLILSKNFVMKKRILFLKNQALHPAICPFPCTLI